ncbi:MAG TPA: Gfo/Idh/MocA family oxidoreductase [Tepidisphaeraceae bacterium]|nr:Gfo/Idh/MocA family oxidoreductase [Tepidisphaeraceae bacterium]
MDAMRVGIIGCGAISGAYLKYAKSFPVLEMAACADINMDAARKLAEEFDISKVCSVDELLKDQSIQIVLNLTIPKAHVPVSLAAIKAGKHVYCEKPLGVNRAEGAKLMSLAKSKKLRVGCAPDTFMGSGIQTARKMIDDGAIGKPVAFTAFMMCPGHESWHPNPAFYYDLGGGPMMDMGPYYLTALLNFFGPVRRVSGLTSIAIPNRTIASQPRFGEKIRVKTPDHLCGSMEFANGVVGTIITSFATRFPNYDGKQPITVFGTEGTLRVPDPNQFDGEVHIRKNDDPDWTHVPPMFPTGYGRAVGLADMAEAIRSRGKHHASGEQGLAVLDLMQGFLDSSKTGKIYKPKFKYARPVAMDQRS